MAIFSRYSGGPKGFVVLLLGLTIQPAPMWAAGCRIPASLLCDGCAHHLKVKIGWNGTCEISFVADPATKPTGAPAKFVDLEVEVHHWPARKRHAALDDRAGAANRLRQAAATRSGRAPPSCFVFADRHYCE
jgi:hypothetical protein